MFSQLNDTQKLKPHTYTESEFPNPDIFLVNWQKSVPLPQDN